MEHICHIFNLSKYVASDGMDKYIVLHLENKRHKDQITFSYCTSIETYRDLASLALSMKKIPVLVER